MVTIVRNSLLRIHNNLCGWCVYKMKTKSDELQWLKPCHALAAANNIL